MIEKQKGNSIVMLLSCLLLIACIALSSMTFYQGMETQKMVKLITGEAEDVNKEDDVLIALTYMIKSTLPISDAYKSGDRSKLSEADKETLDLANEILKEIIQPNMDDFEKEKAVYVWLTSKLKSTTGILNVIQTGERENDNPHDVLKYRSAVCVGYATTFRLFMQMLGIECKVVHSSDLTHSWNLVKLEDAWYHVDCYNDSEAASFINFNMNDTICAMNHDWTREYVPKADGKKYNYIFSVCESKKNIYQVPAWLMKSIQKKKTVISCTFEEAITAENESAAMYMTEMLTSSLSNEQCVVSPQWITNEKEEYVLCFYITYTDEITTQVDEETVQKINDTIFKAMEKYGFSFDSKMDIEGKKNIKDMMNVEDKI